MKFYFLRGIILLSLFLLNACPILNKDNSPNDESAYNIPIIWESDIQNPYYITMTGDETHIYVYSTIEYPFFTARLNKIDHETGKTIWSTDYFEISHAQPLLIGNCVYATAVDSVILCFDKDTGVQLAQFQIIHEG
jgi:outer membrane protein assembly factor BamB